MRGITHGNIPRTASYIQAESDQVSNHIFVEKPSSKSLRNRWGCHFTGRMGQGSIAFAFQNTGT
jgi:hypothetical protein